MTVVLEYLPLKVVSHEGVCLNVPLLGRRPQPLLKGELTVMFTLPIVVLSYDIVSSLPVWYSHPTVQSVNIITCSNTGEGLGSYTVHHKVFDCLYQPQLHCYL